MSDHGTEATACGSYGWSVEYRDCGGIDLGRAEIMAKTLRAVRRGMGKQAAEQGWPLSFGQYVAHALKALGVSLVIVLGSEPWDCYADMRHKVSKPGEAVYEIDRLTRTTVDKLQGKVAA